MSKAFINGEYLDLADAKISIFDRGLLFGDSIYEVLPVYNGQAFFIDRHLDRLNNNLNQTKIENPDLNWHSVINELIQANGGGNFQVYIQVTRGNQGVRKHDIPSSINPTVFAFVLNNPFPSREEKEKGLKAKLIEDIRWLRCDIKTTSLLGNILLNDDAVTSGYQTTILSRNGVITEGSTANVFVVTPDGTIKTPPLNQLCLPGVTRYITLELINQLNWSVAESEFSENELFGAQEVWITSTTKEIFPVTQINDKIIGKGVGGVYWQKIEPLYQNLIS